jgi:hypothetical protein
MVMGIRPPPINLLKAWSGQVSRIWQIREQVIEDPSTKLRLDFSSVYTDEVNAGNEPPTHDGLVVLRLWTSDRTRIASFLFERNGRFIKCEVEPLPTVEQVAGAQPGERVTAELMHTGADVSFTQGEMDRRIANEPGVRQPLPPDVQFDPKGPPAGGDPRYNDGNTRPLTPAEIAAGIGKPAFSGL